MSRLKVLAERFGYLAGYQDWADDLAKMDKELDELSTLRTQLESKDKLIKNFCHTENEVEKSALKVLTDLQVHGDSFGVPGTNQIVDTLVSEVQSLRTRLAEVEAQLQEAVRLLVRHLPPTRKEKSCE